MERRPLIGARQHIIIFDIMLSMLIVRLTAIGKRNKNLMVVDGSPPALDGEAPIPEQGTRALLLTGLAGVFLLRYRRPLR
jgi:hypothetical protein